MKKSFFFLFLFLFLSLQYLVMRDLELPKISNSLEGLFGISKSLGKLLLCLDMLGRLTLGGVFWKDYIACWYTIQSKS